MLTINIKTALRKATVVKKTKKNTSRSKWVTEGIMKSCLTKEILYQKWKNSFENENLKQQYKNYVKWLNKVITAAKYNFDKEEFEKASNNNKKMWDFVKRKSNKTKNKYDKKIDYLTDNLNNIYQTEYIAETFNKFLSCIGSKLTKEIKKPKMKYKLPKANIHLPYF